MTLNKSLASLSLSLFISKLGTMIIESKAHFFFFFYENDKCLARYLAYTGSPYLVANYEWYYSFPTAFPGYFLGTPGIFFFLQPHLAPGSLVGRAWEGTQGYVRALRRRAC